MKISIMIEIEQKVIGGEATCTVTPNTDMTTTQGLTLCHAGMQHFLHIQRQGEAKAMQQQARQSGLLGPDGKVMTQ